MYSGVATGLVVYTVCTLYNVCLLYILSSTVLRLAGGGGGQYGPRGSKEAGRLQEDALGEGLHGLQAAVLRRQAEGGEPRHPGSRQGGEPTADAEWIYLATFFGMGLKRNSTKYYLIFL